MPKHLTWPEPKIISKPRWPGWVRQLTGPCRVARVPGTPPGLTVRAGQGARFALLEARVAGAYMMDGLTFQRRTREAYLALARVLDAMRARHAVRFWNYLPFIHTPVGGDQDRYMAFNAGRYEAFCAWFGGPDRFAQLLPTATGVGHHGSDLEIHVLGCTRPGLPVESPRQRSAYRYSPQYGPLPPCFSRATVLAGTGPNPTAVLIGGTASVYGEVPDPVGDVRRQTAEALATIGAVIRRAAAAAGDLPPGAGADPPADGEARDDRPWLAHCRELRVYFPRAHDESRILAILRDHCESLAQVELFPADLCRTDLRVEISGFAELPPSDRAARRPPGSPVSPEPPRPSRRSGRSPDRRGLEDNAAAR